MNINFQNLDLIEDILKMVKHIQENQSNTIEKRWLNVNELSVYLGYSKDSINKFVQKGEFESGIHFHQKFKRLLFDKIEVDKWVISNSPKNNTTYNRVDQLTDEIISSILS